MGQHYPNSDYLTGDYGAGRRPGRAITFGVTFTDTGMATDTVMAR